MKHQSLLTVQRHQISIKLRNAPEFYLKHFGVICHDWFTGYCSKHNSSQPKVICDSQLDTVKLPLKTFHRQELILNMEIDKFPIITRLIYILALEFRMTRLNQLTGECAHANVIFNQFNFFFVRSILIIVFNRLPAFQAVLM